MTSTCFSDPLLLSGNLYKFLTGEELAKVSLVNKASAKATEVDHLWERLCMNSNIYHLGKVDSWKQHYIQTFNWNHGRYQETSKICSLPSYIYAPSFRSPYRAIPTRTGIEIQLLETGNEIFLNAPGFMYNLSSYLKDMVFTSDYVFIKTNAEIQIYKRQTGDKLRAIPVTNPDWVTAFEETVACIDRTGVVRVWNITSGELLWEERFLNHRTLDRITFFFKFLNKTTLRLFRYDYQADRSIKSDLWDLDIETKSINEPNDFQVDANSSILKQQYAEIRKKKLTQNKIQQVKPPPSFSSQYDNVAFIYSLNEANAFWISGWTDVTACTSVFSNTRGFSFTRQGFSDIRILDKKYSLLYSKRLENLEVNKIIFTYDKMLIIATEMNSMKSQVITCDFNPQNHPQKAPDPIKDSNLAPTFIRQTMSSRFRSIALRINDIAKKVFTFLSYPFRKLAELSIYLLKGTVRVIQTFNRRI